MDLFMPNKLRRKQVFKNITGKDLLHTAIASAIFSGITFLVCSLTLGNTSSRLIMTVIISLVGTALIFSLHTRFEETNLNMIEYLISLVNHIKRQKYYPFKKNREW